MDTTETTSTDLLPLNADSDQDVTPSFGSEVAKTLALSTATSAVVFGGFFAIAALTPKVTAWFKARKNKAPKTVEEALAAATAKAESLKTEKD